MASRKWEGNRFRKLHEQLGQVLLILGKAIVGTVQMGDKPIQANGDKVSQIAHWELSKVKNWALLT
jgi:hypothetical protein